jgi:subtilisin family serine protease
VGVINTRIRDHPDLKDKVVIHRDYVGDNIVDHAKWNPHGTHVAGTIAGTSTLLCFFMSLEKCCNKTLNGDHSFVCVCVSAANGKIVGVAPHALLANY